MPSSPILQPLSVFLGANLGLFVHYRRSIFRTLPPRWRWTPGVLAGAFGYAFGEFDGFATNLTFERGLRDPQAVQQSIRNVRTRLSHPEHFQENTSQETWHNQGDLIMDKTASSSPSRVQVKSDEPEIISVRPSECLYSLLVCRSDKMLTGRS